MTSTQGGNGSTAGSGRGAWVGLLVAVVAVVVVVVLMTRTRQLTPFMVDSTAPEGYAAIAELWEDEGARVRAQPSSSLLDTGAVEPGDRTVVVPVPGYASEQELAELRRLAEAGATVVLGEPWPLGGTGSGDEPAGGEPSEDFLGPDDLPFESFGGSYGARELADTPAVPRGPGDCDIPGLDALGPIDVAFAWDFPPARGDQTCYGDPATSAGEPVDELVVVSARQVGEGRVITLGSPYLWVNARLQPAKEDGGRPLANAATALVLTGATPGVQIDVIDPTPSSDPSIEGSEGPLELMPLPVRLALAQLVVVVLLFLWWRSVRLGRPVEEPLPVEIAGSELVVAVGDLLRRKGSPERAAAALRSDARSVLAARLGTTGARDEVLVATVAARSGRSVDDVHAALIGGAPVDSSATLVQLARTLDSIRTEVLSVPEPA
ncbi:MAG: DUF4350 domain-containing protein [Actinomycetota bacterium]|nr:DUF4350 domain-containing protein [Actinomycetota bacterium]